MLWHLQVSKGWVQVQQWFVECRLVLLWNVAGPNTHIFNQILASLPWRRRRSFANMAEPRWDAQGAKSWKWWTQTMAGRMGRLALLIALTASSRIMNAKPVLLRKSGSGKKFFHPEPWLSWDTLPSFRISYIFFSKNRCAYKNSCTVVSTNEAFGDPCYGTYKYLRLRYSCIPLNWRGNKQTIISLRQLIRSFPPENKVAIRTPNFSHGQITITMLQ